MDRFFEHRGTLFVWNEAKAAANMHKHGISFEEAATVFDDPLFKFQDASRNDEGRDAVIGPRNPSMINERLRKRLKKDRPTTTITMRIQVDVVESLKAIAPTRGFTAYQTLLKSYISEGLRRDEAELEQQTARKLTEALKRRGVPESLLQEALAEAQHAT